MITIIIPTINRSDFLIRQLNYYADTGFKHWIFIADSSTGSHLEKTKKAVERLKDKLKILHKEYPGMNNAQCFQNLNNYLTTPYAVFCGDDDFLIPAGLEKCAKFLKNNNNFHAVYGKAILFWRNNEGTPTNIECASYTSREILQETPSERLIDYMKNYTVTLFALHKSESWKEMFHSAYSKANIAFSTEIIPCSISAVLGKKKFIETLYLVRECHRGKYMQKSVLEQIIAPEWHDTSNVFCDTLSLMLTKKEGLNKEAATYIVKKALCEYLCLVFSAYKKNQVLEEKSLSKIEQLKQNIKSYKTSQRFIIPFWKIITRIKRKIILPDIISLETLLDKRSVYHKDFLEVYNAIRK